MRSFLRELNSRIELNYLGTAFGTEMNPAKLIGIIHSDLPLFFPQLGLRIILKVYRAGELSWDWYSEGV